MKKTKLICLILAALLTLCGCDLFGRYDRSGDYKLSLYDCFMDDGRIYIQLLDQSSVSKQSTRIVDNETQTEVLTVECGTGTAYMQETGRLYYTEKHKVVSSAAGGADKKTEYKVPHKTRNDKVTIAFAKDTTIIVRVSYASIEGMGQDLKFKCSYPSEMYYTYDIVTSKTTHLIEEGGSGLAPAFLDISEGTVYYAQPGSQSGKTDIYSRQLSSAERTLIGTIEPSEDARITGTVFEDDLYICYDGKAIAFPAAGGEARDVAMDIDELVPVAAGKAEDHLLYLMMDEATGIGAVYELHTEYGVLTRTSAKALKGAAGFKVFEDECCIYSTDQAVTCDMNYAYVIADASDRANSTQFNSI